MTDLKLLDTESRRISRYLNLRSMAAELASERCPPTKVKAILEQYIGIDTGSPAWLELEQLRLDRMVRYFERNKTSFPDNETIDDMPVVLSRKYALDDRFRESVAMAGDTSEWSVNEAGYSQAELGSDEWKQLEFKRIERLQEYYNNR
jgi:hypothetical protein